MRFYWPTIFGGLLRALLVYWLRTPTCKTLTVSFVKAGAVASAGAIAASGVRVLDSQIGMGFSVTGFNQVLSLWWYCTSVVVLE